MADAAAAISTIQSMQIALQLLQTITPTAWQYPPQCSVQDGDSFDFIVVGGGSSGSVVASRLTENEDVNVLLIEAGGYPPIESEYPAWFTLLARSVYDYNITSTDDGKTAQNLQGKVVTLNQGKMLGGSSSLHHMMHTNGDPEDYNEWARMLNDDKWSFKYAQEYLKKMETLIDQDLLPPEDIACHGTDGPLEVAKDTRTTNEKYLKAFEELGHKIVSDINAATPAVGYTENLFEIANGFRQSSALGYLGRARNRPNLCLALSSSVTKILIEDQKAVGVQVSTANGKTYKVYADNEVIVSAGAINSPKLLMLSGIGPKKHLESFGIDVVADLPVGQNLQDHACAAIVVKTDKCDATTPAANPHQFPAPSFNGYVSLDNSTTTADYDTINLEFQCGSSDILQLSVNMFSYSYDVSQTIFEATKDRKVIFTLLGLVMPKSRGQVLLASTDPAVNPQVYTGMFSNEDDIDLIARAFMDHVKVLDTTYFKSVNASLVDMGVCKDAKTEYEFWRCYAVAMSATMWHYGGTCAMGKVLDSDLNVLGVDSLRVVDASAMPTLIRGKLYAGVMMLAEYGADIIRKDWGI
ncbi:unnamed protein product [Spodoptera littoralis]|uniref:Glucose-methanol-choline oxidoreductase N-terminal domain-containing protein n=1 Tax=Spodoptera littoralis TaxID=7109 RepID=A0A9P0I7A5_SPOLI|nr:unnamed protein product [Spodoptera littoralis]CAH1642398.1 unnamed protein product [Spodoptera littoralis]